MYKNLAEIVSGQVNHYVPVLRDLISYLRIVMVEKLRPAC